MKRQIAILSIAVALLISVSGCEGTKAGGGVSIGPLHLDLSMDRDGRVFLSGGISPKVRLGLGPISLQGGIEETLKLTAEKPYYLFIIWKDSTGEVQRDEYEIGTEFQVNFGQQESVRQIQGDNNSVIVVVERVVKSSTSPITDFTQGDINALLGEGNWSCIPGWPNGISVKNLPLNFVVNDPLIFIDTRVRRYTVSETVPDGGLATGWLKSELPDNPCPKGQLRPTRVSIDAVLGAGNWFCLDESPSGVKVLNISPDFAVQSPLIFVDQYELRYSIGESVPEGPATAWLQGNLSRSECP